LAVNSNSIGQSGDLQAIVNFAIQKEQEAVDFYHDLAARIKNRSLTAELLKIADMEVQHRERLKKLDLVAAIGGATARKVTDLKIADYLVAQEPSPSMTWQDILNIAMHREMASMRLYTDLATIVSDQGAKQLFENLAVEETAHKLFFEKTWDEEILTEN
jgi:rubrerythrin